MAGRSQTDFEADRQFETEVLRLARLLYPDSVGGADVISGSERDGVLVGAEVAVAIEATRSRRLDKAQKDAAKLKQATEALATKYPTRAIRGYFITAEEPTADQRGAVRDRGGPFVTAVSFTQFRAKLFDASAYMAARADYPFGSARDPLTDKAEIKTPYVPLDLLQRPQLDRAWSVDESLVEALGGGTVIITGEYGVGKSMTLREMWLRQRGRWQKDPAQRVPIHLNLRNHQGQDDPSEALHRHADRIGFGDHTQLVRAWRSGQTVLLLDGFDEITFPGWVGRASGLAEVRRRNVALIRRFAQESPSGTGMVVAGRSHFFDSDAEMQRSLGLPAQHASLSASDFTTAQIQSYLKTHHVEAVLPDWLPTRPLLVGYLAARGLLPTGLGEGVTPAAGWDLLLQSICDREAEIDVGLDGHLIRRIIERLASRARRTSSGRGPLRFDDLNEAFREVCSYQPDEGSRVVLDRLPGLGVGAVNDASSSDLPREFVDSDLADAARAGDVFNYVVSPRAPGIAGDLRDWDYLLEELGLEVVFHRTATHGLADTSIASALAVATGAAEGTGLVADLLRLVIRTGGQVRAPAPVIAEFVLPTLTVGPGADAGASILRDCIIERLELEDGYAEEGLPRMVQVDLQAVDGAAGEEDLPAAKFESCSFSAFSESTQNTASIQDLTLSDKSKVVLTILKKVYAQRGRGRKDSALARGLDPRLRPLVPDALATLQQERMIVQSRSGRETVWLPVRTSQRRALQVLASPMSTSDSLITR